MHKIAKYIVENNFKITLFTIIFTLLFQFKQLFFAPIIILYDKIPSLSQTYDAILSYRSPFKDKQISANEELILAIKNLYQEKNYSDLAILNVEFLVQELLILQDKQPDEYEQKIEQALSEINQFKFTESQNIFLKLAEETSKDLKEKYLGLAALSHYFSNKIEAINIFNKGLQLNPNNLFLLNNLGRIYTELESFANASIVFKKIITIGKKEKNDKLIALGHSNIGVLALKQNNHMMALKNFNKALILNQKNQLIIAEANQYTNIALTYEANNQIDKACINLRKARIIYYKNYYDDIADKMTKKLKKLSCI